jgi:hypothetical protein
MKFFARLRIESQAKNVVQKNAVQKNVTLNVSYLNATLNVAHQDSKDLIN